jgi:predicted amidophosphoribosyltransferase
MIDTLLSVIAPHQCCECGKIGTPLCNNCKYNIISEIESVCIVCRRPCGPKGICNSCRAPYERAWHVGIREGALQRLVGLYKFERLKSAYKQLGDLLLETIPDLPEDVIVMPIPTASSHIRERGYDHMLLIAKYLTKKRGLELSRSLRRSTQAKQRQASAKQREVQAKSAFWVADKLKNDAPYLLIDDIMTTGSTVKYAAKALKAAGAGHVWLAVIGRQTLD